jgi:hypothetical protein
MGWVLIGLKIAGSLGLKGDSDDCLFKLLFLNAFLIEYTRRFCVLYEKIRKDDNFFNAPLEPTPSLFAL